MPFKRTLVTRNVNFQITDKIMHYFKIEIGNYQ